MPTIASIRPDFYHVPLPVVLTDSTHGEMGYFELVTVRVMDSEGVEGVGYTYTVGAGGGAIHDMIRRDLAPVLVGQQAANIEALWQKMWWTLHYGGRGGQSASAISAVDIALWDLKAKKAALPLYQLLGGFDPRVPCYAGGVDLWLTLDDLLRQTDGNLAKGFRAIKMKVGRPRLSEDVTRVEAMRRHLGEDFPLMVDANMRWTVDQAIRAARALAPSQIVWLEEPTIPDDVHGHARIVRDGGVPVAGRHQLRGRDGLHEGRASRRRFQPAADFARCARHHRPSAGGGAQSLLPGSAWIRVESVYREPAADCGWQCGRA
jgi:L-alanine-DL-glutamate epimerase-like enolase superfamily enzyme